MKKVLIAVVLSLAFMGSASATGLWVIIGQVTLSGSGSGDVSGSGDGDGSGDGYGSGDC